jgi:hypothetical protein
MSTRLLALDLSTKTGWARFVDGEYEESGAILQVKVVDFNVNNDPQLQAAYPYNVVDAAAEVARRVGDLVTAQAPDVAVLENTNRGKNRHTQRLLENIHLEVLKLLREIRIPAVYMDSSTWRRIVDLKLSKDEKKNNRDVSAGKKRGRVTKKHLAVNMCNARFGLKLLVKDNDEADAILLGLAYTITNPLVTGAVNEAVNEAVNPQESTT